MKKFVAFMLSMIIFFGMVSPVVAVELDDAVTVEYVLQQLEEGKATEVMEVIELSELTAEEIENNPSIKNVVDRIAQQEKEENSKERIVQGVTVSGPLYMDTITDATGATVTYYLQPRLKVEYGDIGQNEVIPWTSTVLVNAV